MTKLAELSNFFARNKRIVVFWVKGRCQECFNEAPLESQAGLLYFSDNLNHRFILPIFKKITASL